MRSTSSNFCLILAVGSALAGCDEPRYSIAGTVSGLVGDGLVLACEGVPLRIDANGELRLAGTFASRAGYAVTVTRQPSAPAQVCTVTSGVGVVRANVTDVAVTCVTAPLTTTASTPASGATDVATNVAPSVARLSDGSFVAVWYPYDGGLANVWANTYSDGSG